MKIALVGYGKMGHMIESSAKAKGHEVVATIDIMAKDATGKIFGAPKRLANDIIINIKIKCNQAQEGILNILNVIKNTCIYFL